MAKIGDVIIRFDEVTFGYPGTKKILDEVSFSVRRGSKIALMGQNGAGKTTLFSMITDKLEPEEGQISINNETTTATAKQIIPRDWLNITIREYFEKAFEKKIYDIDPRIDKVQKAVNLDIQNDRKIGTLSGGQQARLLLAFALIQNPDILLLDEPTNNLDKEGIAHLKQFISEYENTCIVISHDAEFLNAFTDGVLYLDSFNHKIEQYTGNYSDVVKEIEARIERERMQNARLEKEIVNRKEQMNFFAQKGGHMRDVAAKMRAKIGNLEENVVEVRKEDRTIRSFGMPIKGEISNPIATITSLPILKRGKLVEAPVKITLRKGDKLLIKGPNGIGKTTMLEAIASGKAKGFELNPEAHMGFYRQDFSTLDFNKNAYESLAEVMKGGSEEDLRSCAAGFLLTSNNLKNRVGDLSEGQKGLLMFARIVLEKPELIILDEPTNHINFRHIPIIAKSVSFYGGVAIIVSHMPDFVNQINFTEEIDLEDLIAKSGK